MKIISALIATALATALWFYLLRYGGTEKLRAVDRAAALTDFGDANAGYEVISKNGCGACHQIPGIPGAAGQIGAPLDGFKDRLLIAGILPNTSENLIKWLQDPPAIEPGTAMPNLGLTEKQARDAAAYLYAPR